MDWISLRACRVAGIPCSIAFGYLMLASIPVAHAEEPGIRVARLVRDLGAADYAKRQRADDDLAALGRQTRAELRQALGDPDAEIRLRAKRLLERLEVDDLWAASTVSFQAQDQPATKALSIIAAQSGNHVHIGEPYGTFTERTLDFNFVDTGYWQALDWICERTGNRIRPHYDMHTPGIVVCAGTNGKSPRAYGGPVRAQITTARRVFIEELNYEDEKAELTHSFQINLRFNWEDRFRIVGYATQPELVEAVTDNRVVVSPAQPAGRGWNATTRGLREVTASLKLNPVPVTAKSLETFAIKWGLVAVGEPATLEIARLEIDKLYSQDDLAVKIESIEAQPLAKHLVTISVMRDLVLPEPQEVVFQEYDVELFDAKGVAFRLQNQAHSLSDRGVQLKLAFNGDSAQSEPTSLKLHYPRLRARRDLHLVFHDVPLPLGKPE